MNAKMDMFDFLRKGEANLSEIEGHLKTKGYEIHELKQPDRHVIGKISMMNKDNNIYFLKMASRPELSLYIENEYAWHKILHAKHCTTKWPLSVPQVYTLDKMGELSWFTMEYVGGVNGEENPRILDSTVKPVAAVIADIIRLKPSDKLPLDRQQPHKDIQERITKRLTAYLETIGHGHLDSGLISFLKDNIQSLQSAPARGDVGIENILQDRRGRSWLVDSEFASFKNIRFYDVGYYYFRLGVNGNRIDLAEEFLEEFKKIYPMTPSDEKILQWMLLYRLVGGYFEALKNPFLYPGIKKLQSVIFRKF